MDTVCPFCGLPKRTEDSVCVYCQEAGRRVVVRKPRWFRFLNQVSLAVAVLVVLGGFWKVFIAPVRASRKKERRVAASKPLSPEREAKCAELLETYQSATYAAFHIKRGDGRVGRRMAFMESVRAKMRQMGCPNAP